MQQEQKLVLNYEPLTQKVSTSKVYSFMKTHIFNSVLGILSIVFGTFLIGAVFIFALIMILVGLSGESLPVLIIGLVLLAVCPIIAWGIIHGLLSSSAQQLRMQEFASSNGITQLNHLQNPAYPGLIFNEGDSRGISAGYIFPFLNNAELGNFSYSTGSGKNRTTHTYGYIKLPLPRQLPHMLLDAKSNNLFGKISNLPAMFSGDQKLSLEGDFNNYFTLYAPKEYETDALYIFTPDVMQALIQSTKNYDVEIVDGWMFLYSNDHFNLTDHTEIQQLLYVASILSKELFEQSDYYADARVGDRTSNTIAYEGRRLKRNNLPFSIGGIFAFLYFGYSIFSDGTVNIIEVIAVAVVFTLLSYLFMPLFNKK